MTATGRTSVVIPCYNVDAYLPEALASVRAQTVAAREIVLVDDGSRIPVRIPDAWDGPPIHLIRKGNGGLPAARNTGIQAASGEFVAFLDADDHWAPRKLELQEAAMDARPDAPASYTRCVAAPGYFAFGPWPPLDVSMDEFLFVLWYGQFFPPSSTMIRRAILKEVGGFEERLRIGEDLELWCRLLRRGPFVQVPEPLCHYRQHAQQLTSKLRFRIEANAEARRIIIARDADLLERAGIPKEKFDWAERNEILLAFYRRQFDVARPLLWKYWWAHKSDLRVLRCAVASLLPRALFGVATPEHVGTPSAAPTPRTRIWGEARAEVCASLTT